MPNDAELRRTGVSFTRAFTASAMCSPSRASLLTGTYPSRHGVTLTMTEGDLFPDPRNLPDVLRTARGWRVSGEVPRGRLARAFGRGCCGCGPQSGNEPELPAGHRHARDAAARARLPRRAARASGTSPSRSHGRAWSAADPERIERDYGFADWEPPDAGGDAKAETFGGGNAGTTARGLGRGLHTADGGLARPGRPPRAVLPGLLARQPARRARLAVLLRARAATRPSEFADLDVPLPPTVDEDLRDKPTVQSLMKLGPDGVHRRAARRAEEQRYVELLRAPAPRRGREDRPAAGGARRPGRPGSLRSRTVIARTSDHGELGLSHGGLRQKMFNAYEESIRVPLVISNPAMLPSRGRATRWSRSSTSCRRCSAWREPVDAGRFDGRDLGPLLRGERDAVRDAVLFTYDDHQAGTAFQDVPGQPNRIRCVRDAAGSTPCTWTRPGRRRPSTSSTTSRATRTRRSTWPTSARAAVARRGARAERRRLHGLLEEACRATATLTPPLPPAP